jgi:hypothetical protein
MVRSLCPSTRFPVHPSEHMTPAIAFTGDLFLGMDAADRPLDGLAAQLPPGVSLFLNVEGTLHESGQQLDQQRPKISLTSPVDVLAALNRLPIHAICVSNNHIADYGDGVAALTCERLGRLAPTFGAGRSDDEGFHRAAVRTPQATLGYAAYCTTDTSPLHATGTRIGPRDLSPEVAAADLRDLRSRSDFAVAIVHWGDEYFHYPSDLQVERGRMLIDLGFDVVIGSHPHAVQGFEVHRGKHIFYSLGNFCFPDYVAEVAGYQHTLRWLPRCRWGLMPVFSLRDGALEFERFHTLVADGRRVTIENTPSSDRRVARLAASLTGRRRSWNRRIDAARIRYEEFAVRPGKGAILARKAAELVGIRRRATRRPALPV